MSLLFNLGEQLLAHFIQNKIHDQDVRDAVKVFTGVAEDVTTRLLNHESLGQTVAEVWSDEKIKVITLGFTFAKEEITKYVKDPAEASAAINTIEVLLKVIENGKAGVITDILGNVIKLDTPASPIVNQVVESVSHSDIPNLSPIVSPTIVSAQVENPAPAPATQDTVTIASVAADAVGIVSNATQPTHTIINGVMVPLNPPA
jgi:hypothetical protein